MEKLVYSDDLELIVCGANIAGHMENDGLIYCEDDSELTYFLLEILHEYGEKDEDELCDVPFSDYVYDRLMEEYGTSAVTY